jgi:hypothetical protein
MVFFIIWCPWQIVSLLLDGFLCFVVVIPLRLLFKVVFREVLVLLELFSWSAKETYLCLGFT